MSYKSPWARHVGEVSGVYKARTAIHHGVTAQHAFYLVSLRPAARSPGGDGGEEGLENQSHGVRGPDSPPE